MSSKKANSKDAAKLVGEEGMAGDSKALERYKDEFDPYQAFLVNGRSRQSGHSEDIEKTPKDLRELDLNKGNGGGSHGTAKKA